MLLIGLLLAGSSITWKSDLIFSHKFHMEEVEADCATCHDPAANSITGQDDLLPEMETCYECHDEDDTECTVCHRQPDEPILLPRIADYSPKFTHKNHIARNIPCEKCHPGIAQSESVEQGLHLPQMATCMSCHELPQTSEGCYLCHTKDESLTPASHLADWTHRHGLLSEANRQECYTCHTENYCADCHQGENLSNQIHPPEFIATHSISYLTRESDCVGCHQGKEFCAECHVHVNHVVPASHHLPDWAASGHGEAARTDFENCTVCHLSSDLTCAECHN